MMDNGDLRAVCDLLDGHRTGAIATLEPLTLAHASGLAGAAQDSSIWGYALGPPLRDRADAERFINDALARRRSQTEVPFAIRCLETDEICGTTRFLQIEPEYHCLEIGMTWLASSAHGSGVNVEAKYLLLAAAFERAGMVRVEFQTDHRNARSQGALTKIGATYEGTLRRYHAHARNGFQRNTMVYSIVREEWPARKHRLEQLIYAAGL